MFAKRRATLDTRRAELAGRYLVLLERAGSWEEMHLYLARWRADMEALESLPERLIQSAWARLAGAGEAVTGRLTHIMRGL